MKQKINVSVCGSQAPDYRISDLSPERQERIMELTMKKVNQNTQPKKHRRTTRIAVLAAAAAVLLCGSVFAYTTNLFGFAEIFGAKAPVVSRDVVAFGENSKVVMTQPVYTEEEQRRIEAGTMMVPDLGELSENGVGASTEDYTFTLEEMLATPDTLLAIVRVDARNENAEAALNEETPHPFLTAINNSKDGKDKERINGGLSYETISREEGTARLLVRNSGGVFAEGDKILFHHHTESANVDLFEVPVTHLMEEKVALRLDKSAYKGKGFRWDTLTITPISVVADGSYTVSPERSIPVIVVELTDGTSFELANFENGFPCTSLGDYGSMSFGGYADAGTMKASWIFSQVVDLNEIGRITVDGTEYLMN